MSPWSSIEKAKRVFYIETFFLIVLSVGFAYLFKDRCSNCKSSDALRCIWYLCEVLRWSAYKDADVNALVIGFASIIYVLIFGFWIFKFLTCPIDKCYGDAHFANRSDLRKMGFFSKSNTGIVVGKIGNFLLKIPALRHGLVLAPTRSGKTAGFVIPTALSFKGSLIIADPKGELEQMLSEPLRRKGKKIYSIDWSNENSKDKWNPLSLKVFPSVIENFSKAERQAERIAAMLVNADKEDHWTTNAKKHIAALILLAVYEAEYQTKIVNPMDPNSIKFFKVLGEPHLDTVYHYIARGVDKEKIMNNDPDAVQSAKHNLYDVIARAIKYKAPDRIVNDLSSWYNAPESEAGSHMTTFLSKVQIWRSRAVRGATSKASFEWQDLRDQACAVFIKFPQQDAQTLGVLTALFFEMFFGWALDTPRKSNEAPIAILADEFASLPKINLMTDFLSKGAGIGSVIWLIVQDFSQIKETYGNNQYETIKTNCSYLLTYAQNNFNTQKELALMTGKTTRKKINKSTSAKGTESKSFCDEAVDLMPVSEWGAIPFGHHVLLVQNFMTCPVYCKTPLFFKERSFVKQLHIKASKIEVIKEFLYMKGKELWGKTVIHVKSFLNSMIKQ